MTLCKSPVENKTRLETKSGNAAWIICGGRTEYGPEQGDDYSHKSQNNGHLVSYQRIVRKARASTQKDGEDAVSKETHALKERQAATKQLAVDCDHGGPNPHNDKDNGKDQ
jgi:hypothetical protein